MQKITGPLGVLKAVTSGPAKAMKTSEGPANAIMKAARDYTKSLVLGSPWP